MLFTKEQLKWNYIHSLLTVIFKPISFLILAKLVRPEDYGLITIALIIVSFVEMIRERGFIESYIKFYSNKSIYSSTFFIFSVVSGICIYILIYILSPIIVNIINIKHDDVTLIIQIVSIQILLSSISTIYQAYLIKNMDYKLLTKIEIFPSLVPFLVTIPLALLNFGVWALVTGLIIASSIKTILLIINIHLRLKFEFDFTIIKKIIIFMKYIFLESFLNWFYVWGDKAILANFITLPQLGLYSVATQVVNLVYGFSFSISKMNYTYLCNLNENIYLIKEYVIKYINISVFISIILYFCLYYFSNLFVYVLGENWMGLDKVILLLGISYSLSYTITSIVPDALKSINKPQVMPKIQFLKLLYTIPIFIISANYFGFEGFLIGKITTVGIGTCIFYYIAYKYIGVNIGKLWNDINKYIYITLFAFLIQYLFNIYIWNSIFSSIVFFIIYLSLIYVYNKNVLLIIINFIRKN